MFEILQTGIDGMDALLGGGIRYPEDSASFSFITGETGTGKTLLGLELLVRAWVQDDCGGRTFLFYSVEQSPKDIQKKLDFDFGGYFGAPNDVRVLPSENSQKLCLETDSPSGPPNRLVITQASPDRENSGFCIDIGWIEAEIGNYGRVRPVGMVCIDNVGLLLTGMDYIQKRSALLHTRRELMRNHIHGIFIQEEGGRSNASIPSAEELSTDLLIHLSFREGLDFKARLFEIRKARHQYYYRGAHNFSIAGKGVQRDLYLGARSERGPGTHIYPSVAAQLSIVRDQSKLTVPPRGTEPISFLGEEVQKAFKNNCGPGSLSSTVILAEPGTRYSRLALRFLSEGLAAGETGLFVSTKEDQDAVERVCRNRKGLSNLCQGDKLHPSLRLLYLHPEFLSPGKFVSDILRMVDPGNDPGADPLASRLAFDNIYKLHNRFPLLQEESFLVPALLDLLRYRRVTPLFVDLVAQSNVPGDLGTDPAIYLSTFDNVLHLFLKEVDGEPRSFLRILKSVGNDYQRTPFQISL